MAVIDEAGRKHVALGRRPHHPFIDPNSEILHQPRQGRIPVFAEIAKKGERLFDPVRILGEDPPGEGKQDDGQAAREPGQKPRRPQGAGQCDRTRGRDHHAEKKRPRDRGVVLERRQEHADDPDARDDEEIGDRQQPHGEIEFSENQIKPEHSRHLYRRRQHERPEEQPDRALDPLQINRIRQITRRDHHDRTRRDQGEREVVDHDQPELDDLRHRRPASGTRQLASPGPKPWASNSKKSPAPRKPQTRHRD